MNTDLDALLRNWPYKPGNVLARLVEIGGKRQVIQMRVELGILQLETSARPDGTRPEGFATYFEYLKDQARKKKDYVLSETQCEEADREFLQFYQRRICWLALQKFDKAIRDADHTLGFMDLVKAHSPSEEYTQAHEQYRGFVLFHRTQAATQLELGLGRAEKAIDELRSGLERMKAFFRDFEMEEQMEDVDMIRYLRSLEEKLRREYKIDSTLQEQLEEAVRNEDYEKAAQLRDRMKKSR